MQRSRLVLPDDSGRLDAVHETVSVGALCIVLDSAVLNLTAAAEKVVNEKTLLNRSRECALHKESRCRHVISRLPVRRSKFGNQCFRFYAQKCTFATRPVSSHRNGKIEYYQ